MSQGNGWDEHKLLVLDALKRMDERLESIDSKQDLMNNKFIQLESEAKAVKYIGGVALPIGVTLGINWLGRKIGL